MADTLPPPERPEPSTRPQASVLRPLGESCLWLILIGVVVYFGVQLASRLLVVLLPTLLALVLASLLTPLVRGLRARGVPPAGATLAVLVGVLLVVAALTGWIAPQVADQVEELSTGLTNGLDTVERWLVEGPLGLSQTQVTDAFDRLEQLVRDNVGTLAQLGLSGATVLLQVLAGLLLAIVLLFFFLKDGDRLWSGLQGFVPRRHREDVRAAGEGAGARWAPSCVRRRSWRCSTLSASAWPS